MNKIISISVWGDSPRYCVGAIRNAEIAQKLLPDWKCRIFVDNTVPTKYINQLHVMENVEVAEVDDKRVFGAFWRFYSMFESEDNITISRDSDSRISEREIKVINEWLTSNKKFSIIRDHDRHYDWPILAGMWGMKGTLEESLLDKMIEYSKNHFYTIDQIFLAKEIWPIAQNDCFIHGFKEIKWMTESKEQIKHHFIGQGYDENDNPIYDYSDSGSIINNGQKQISI
jgi:protein O-GlcNAc transferase